jgi:hypothetical protein
MQRIRWGTLVAGLAPLSLALPLIAPFLTSGLPITADGEIHLHRMVSAAVNIQAGHLWPRWSPYLHQGFGYPIHNFYSPGLHVLGALAILLLRLDPVAVLKLLQIVATLLYPLGAYLFARTLTGRAGALVAAAAYTYAPFRFHELWVQANLSQFAAMALLPFLLYAISRGAEQRRVLWLALTGVCFGALVLLHHPTGFLAAPVAGLYALLALSRCPRHERLRALSITLGGLALGVALSAVFWLPALAELRDTQLAAIEHDSAFSVDANSLTLDELLAPNLPVDRAMLNTPSALRAGQAQLAAALIGLLALLPAARTDRWLKLNVAAGAVLTVLCLYLITPESVQIWETLPLANLIVYPWRLLGIVAVAVLPGAAALPCLLNLLPRRGQPTYTFSPLKRASLIQPGALAPGAGQAAAGALVGLFFAAALPLLYMPLAFRDVPPPTPATAIEYEQRTGNVGLTSGDEYLPRGVTERPLGVSKTISYDTWQWIVPLDNDLPKGVSAHPLPAADPASSRYEIQSTDAFALRFHQMFFPGWRVTVDGQEAQITQSPPYGLLTVQMPSGTHEVAIGYEGTPIQHVADWISLMALVGALSVFAVSLIRRRAVTMEHHSATEPLAARIVAVMVGFTVINQTLIVPYTSLFRPRSDPGAPPTQVSLHETFGGVIELLGYDLSASTLEPGQTLSISLYWRLLKPVDRGLRGAVRLTSLNGAQTWGKVESFNLAGTNTRNWPLDRYAVDQYRLTVSPNAPPFLGHLSVAVFISDSGIQYLKTSKGSDEVVLADFRLFGDWKTAPDSALAPADLRFGDQVRLIGLRQWVDEKGQQCLMLRWQPQRELPDYAVMVHLLDGSDQMIGTADSPPLDGLYPTSAWQSGQILDDTHCFLSPTGTASVAVGLYGRADGQRLPATRANGERLPDDSLVIALSR